MTSAFTFYSLARFALFAACFGIAYALGWGNLYGLVGAAVVSAALSWVLLRGPREKVAAGLAERIESRESSSRWDVDAQAEDAVLDAREHDTRG